MIHKATVREKNRGEELPTTFYDFSSCLGFGGRDDDE
jgi:hypothetical protein